MTQVIAPFIFLALSAGLFFSYIQPAFDVLGAFQNQEARVDDALIKSDELKNRTQELLTQYSQYERDNNAMRKLETVLPDAIDPVRLVINIDALAQKHRVTLTSFELPRVDRPTANQVTQTNSAPEEEAPIDPVGVATLKVNARGDYANIKAFLQSLEKSLTILDVQQLALTSNPENESDELELRNAGRLSTSITLNTYWLK